MHRKTALLGGSHLLPVGARIEDRKRPQRKLTVAMPDLTTTVQEVVVTGKRVQSPSGHPWSVSF